MGFSFGHLLVVLFIVLILFGPGRVSNLMGDIGRGIRSLREGLKADEADEAKTPEERKRITHQTEHAMSSERDNKKDSV